jgi:hypothetical protein
MTDSYDFAEFEEIGGVGIHLILINKMKANK